MPEGSNPLHHCPVSLHLRGLALPRRCRAFLFDAPCGRSRHEAESRATNGVASDDGCALTVARRCAMRAGAALSPPGDVHATRRCHHRGRAIARHPRGA